MAKQLAMAIIFGLVASNSAFAEEEKAPGWNAKTLSGDCGRGAAVLPITRSF